MCRKILGTLVLALSACGAEPERDDLPASGSEVSADARPVILFLGTSLTAGYGVDPELAYPARIGRRIDSLGLGLQVVNAGVSGETSAGGLRRIEWLLGQPVAVLVLELGANDGLRGQSPEALEQNLQAIIDRTRELRPEARVVIAGMEAPPNLGRRYTEAFREVFPRVARANDATLIPFLLEGIAGVPERNLPDGIHPTGEGHGIIAETVWDALGPILEGVREAGAAARSP